MELPTVRIQSPGRQALMIIVDAPIEIGREGVGLLLADDRVSRRHARLEPSNDGRVVITDLASANGVVIDGVPIDGPMTLGPGDRAVLGDTELLVQGIASSGRALATEMAPAGSGTTAIERVAEEVSSGVAAGIIGVADEVGTVTIAFSDIESSTERGLAIGDVRWMDVLNHHHDLVKAHVEAHSGRIVKNQGDGFMMAFRSARQGVLASIGLQRDLAKLELDDPDLAVRVRVGLHTGEVLQDDDGDLFGRHVIVAARIGALADGGQILVSNLLKQIAEPRGDIIFGPAIAAKLKGVDDLQEVHDVDWTRSAIDGNGPRE